MSRKRRVGTFTLGAGMMFAGTFLGTTDVVQFVLKHLLFIMGFMLMIEGLVGKSTTEAPATQDPQQE